MASLPNCWGRNLLCQALPLEQFPSRKNLKSMSEAQEGLSTQWSTLQWLSSFLPLFLQLQQFLPISHYIVDHCNVGVALLWYQWILHCIMIWSLFTQDYIMMLFIVLPIWKTASTVGSLELLATIKELKKHTNRLTLRLQPSGFASLPSVAPEPLPSGNGDFVKHAWRSSTDGSVEWIFKTSCKNNWSVAVSIWASKMSSAQAAKAAKAETCCVNLCLWNSFHRGRTSSRCQRHKKDLLHSAETNLVA